MFVRHRFNLVDSTIEEIQHMLPQFGYDGFGELVFYRTYSRTKIDGSMETWNDVVIRVTEGTFSIRKDWYLKNNIPWDEDFWQVYARNFAISMFKMEWLPPGRGLAMMGTDFVYQRGSAALQNCALIKIKNIAKDSHWTMDMLMHGTGVGFIPERDDDIHLKEPIGSFEFIIQDTRESWCDSIFELIDCYFTGNPKPKFKYHLIRPFGSEIKSFGGTASGPEPLKELHDRIEHFMESYMYDDTYDSVRLKQDIINSIGVAVVAGGSRRSAELSSGPISDPIFIDLKNYDKYPEREEIGWMSNNSVFLEDDEDFDRLDEIAERIKKNGEPGYINLRNLRKGRIGKKDILREDHAIGFNPCGETQLESQECCTQADTLPTRCTTEERWFKACEYATVYASSVTLLPTHRPETNAVMQRNRRITIGLMDYTGWKTYYGASKVIKWMRQGYDIVRKINEWVNDEAGVPRAIRHTAIKPNGTTSKVAGVTPGTGHPTFIYTLRAIRISKKSKIHPLLVQANIPYEEDIFDKYTDVFYYPIIQGPAKPAREITLWQQALDLVTVQREWSDNAISNTLYFKPKWQLIKINIPNSYKTWNDEKITDGKLYKYNPYHEEDDIEPVLSMIAPVVKSVTMLPHTPAGVYPQSPETGLTEEEYIEQRSKIRKIDWSKLAYNTPDISDDKYCSGGSCSIL